MFNSHTRFLSEISQVFLQTIQFHCICALNWSRKKSYQLKSAIQIFWVWPYRVQTFQLETREKKFVCVRACVWVNVCKCAYMNHRLTWKIHLSHSYYFLWNCLSVKFKLINKEITKLMPFERKKLWKRSE